MINQLQNKEHRQHHTDKRKAYALTLAAFNNMRVKRESKLATTMFGKTVNYYKLLVKYETLYGMFIIPELMAKD